MQKSEQNANSSNEKPRELTTSLSYDHKCEFSLDLKSRTSIRYASFGKENSSGEARDGPVSVIGTIGTVTKASFVDDAILEVVGTLGTLRIDLPSQMLLRSSSSLSTQRESKRDEQ